MAEYQNLCLGCMRPLPVGMQVCPNCSRNNDEIQPSLYLPKRSVLCGKYLIGLVKETASDCVTYAAFDIVIKKPVFICEFLPENLAIRDEISDNVRPRAGYEAMYGACLQSFVSLWQTIQTLNEVPALPTVYEVFGLNSTVYAVCESFESITLDEYFTATESLLSWERVKKVFRPIVTALMQLNSRGIIHGRVSLSTILVGADGKLRLSGFSIPQAKSNVIELRSPCSAGYSPLELSDTRLTICKNTDVYSLAAVMYTAITGLQVQNAADRAVNDLMVIPSDVAQKLPQKVIETIVSALRVHPENRLRSMQEFYDALYRTEGQLGSLQPETNNDSLSVFQTEPETEETPEPKTRPEKDSGPVAMTIKVFLTLLIVLSMLFVTAYSTFLYKYIEVGLLDNALSAVSFLPMNSGAEGEKPEESESTTEDRTTAWKLQYVTVPNFRLLTYSEILQNAAFKRNFEISFEFEASDEVEKNSVISQSVEPGESVEQGSQIIVTISSGKPKIVLKDVMGMNYDEAYRLLTADGFNVEKVVRKNPGIMKPDTVCNMSLVAGIEFEKGTSVTLTVWGEIGG